MKRISYGILTAILFLGIALSQSCVKKDFDTPPDNSGYDPALVVTHTIKEIQNLPSPTTITEDWIIYGIVNMDDKEGNYYKKITIQDETGGIELLLDQNNLYNDFPVGRKVYVKLKGLAKSEYNNLPQLGYTPDATGSLVNVPFTMISDHIIKANYPNTITPTEVTLEQLSSPSVAADLKNKLVVIKNVEFSSEIVGLTIADPANVRSATNRNVQDCAGTKVVVRTSGYAKFQPALIPGGNGTITALFTVFGSTPQLVIRSMDDLQFDGDRCDGSSGSATIILNDGFDNLSNWNAVSVTGDQTWTINTGFGNPKPCVVMSGYSGGTNYENEDWLITKPLSLASDFTKVTFTFESAENYSGTPLACYISTDYSGTGNPNDATWTVLPATYDEATGFVWTPSGDIDLTAYKGQTVYIGFKVMSTTSASKTWEIDNVRITGEKD